MNAPARKFPWWTTGAIVLAILGNLIAVLFPVISLSQWPVGTRGRWMDETAFAFMASAITFLVVAVVVIVAWVKEKRSIVLIAVCLSLTPFFFSAWAMNVVAEARHLVAEP